jgi:hypothetical protein
MVLNNKQYLIHLLTNLKYFILLNLYSFIYKKNIYNSYLVLYNFIILCINYFKIFIWLWKILHY